MKSKEKSNEFEILPEYKEKLFKIINGKHLSREEFEEIICYAFLD